MGEKRHFKLAIEFVTYMTSHLFNKFENVCKFYRFRNRTRAFPSNEILVLGEHNYTGVQLRDCVETKNKKRKKGNEIIIYVERAHG